MARVTHRAVTAFIILAFVWITGIGQACAASDYRGMVDRIGAFLDEALVLYRSGQSEEAKAKVDQSYFEVFENLEGPIRVNISSKKNNELEAEFGAIRAMIKEGRPPEQVESRIKHQIAELRALLPVLESGFQLKAERSDAGRNTPAAKPLPIESRWLESVETIRKLMLQAADMYAAGDGAGARALIIKAQFDGYKNSLLETAIRQHVSQQRDAEFNAEFERIVALMQDGEPASMVRASAEVLVGEIRDELPGVPLIETAKSQNRATSAEPRKDWRGVRADIMSSISQAIGRYRDGEPQRAVALVQDAYFDLFEASGMESRIGARDAAFKSQLESHFSKIVGQMKSGAPAAEIENTAAVMSADFARAAAMLAEGGRSLLALFVYALGIIVREGFEAMLIVTAILAYLAKTGNADKQPVIYNSVAVAVAASVATAILIKWIFARSAASQEMLEGVTFLIASLVLFCMSYWLISKAEAQKWKAYIEGKIGSSISTGSLSALWLTSFLAVYREGAETVLFYQALSVDTDAMGTMAIAGGFVVGCLILALIYLVMHFGARRLPIRSFFLVTSALLYVLAFVFAGKGVMELIEGKVLQPSFVPSAPEIPLLGIFPYWQTLAPQMLLVIAALCAGVVLVRRSAGKSVLPQARSG
ncbi:MAG: FTR1 family iron permease [Rhodoplanes sp.]